MMRILDFLRNIHEPVPVMEFTKLEFTGHREVDKHLMKVSLLMLQQLRHDGMIKCDDLDKTGARIHGLTSNGVGMHERFRDILNLRNLE
ncbi:hypothetical protein [Dyella psychrodurans]|nr:hypothetical protein [Dyella psychrodurans]